MIQDNFSNNIGKASKVIGKTWPLYSFVASNPLSGYENAHFKKAVLTAKHYLNATVFPKATVFKQALQTGEIDAEILSSLLKENKFDATPEFYLGQLEQEKVTELNTNHELDIIMSKWLAAFMDEGLAEWQMPGKEEGFYAAWRQLARYDQALVIKNGTRIPKTSSAALHEVLTDFNSEEQLAIFTYHLAALPGWTGYINYRTEADSSWQQEYPINLEEYLGVRLWIAKNLNMKLLQETTTPTSIKNTELNYVWLKAWEASWQKNIIHTLKTTPVSEETNAIPDVQFVFCIDTRSELIRRHLEAQGNYETFGYAGFFGIAMDYTNLEEGITRKSCPPIVDAAYQVTESAQTGHDEEMFAFKKKNEVSKFKNYFYSRMKNRLPSTFGFVEGAGLFYGFSLIARTLSAGSLYRYKNKKKASFEEIATPEINGIHAEKQNEGIPLADKVAIVKSAFD
jgi:hypothetical protein